MLGIRILLVEYFLTDDAEKPLLVSLMESAYQSLNMCSVPSTRNVFARTWRSLPLFVSRKVRRLNQCRVPTLRDPSDAACDSRVAAAAAAAGLARRAELATLTL